MRHAVTRAFLLAAFVVLCLDAQQPDSFQVTGGLANPRFGHSATLLNDGKVLIAGGVCNARVPTFSCSPEAELYDPATGTFSSTGQMVDGRMFHSATLLADGRVLITGGYFLNRETSKAELYDPATGKFTATADMGQSRRGHSALLLPNGKVLVQGGRQPSEIYDPDLGAFSAAPTPSPSPSWSRSVLLANSHVFTYGGSIDQSVRFDPFGEFNQAINSRINHFYTATSLANANVLIAGGAPSPYDDATTEADIYDAEKNSIQKFGILAQARIAHTATLLPDGKVLLIGGATEFFGDYPWKTAEIFDPAVNRFRLTTATMKFARYNHTATLLRDGRVLVVGGEGNLESIAELYTPSALIPAPELLSLDGTQAAVLHAGTNRPASVNDPASPGEILEIYLTGLNADFVIPPVVFLAGRTAELLYSGRAPGFPSLSQINIRVPAAIRKGAAIPLLIQYLDRPSNTVFIAIQ